MKWHEIRETILVPSEKGKGQARAGIWSVLW